MALLSWAKSSRRVLAAETRKGLTWKKESGSLQAVSSASPKSPLASGDFLF